MSADRKRNKAPKGCGAEYWGKRPMSSTAISHRPGTNARTKQITHKIERQRNKQDREGFWS